MVNKIDDMSFFTERDRNKIFPYVSRGLRYKFDESSLFYFVFILLERKYFFFLKQYMRDFIELNIMFNRIMIFE